MTVSGELKKKRSFISRIRSASMSRTSSSSNQPRSGPFLHLKFGTGRPPEYATRHLFAHEVMKAPPDTLPEGLRTDVQREGIGRYLVNNFKDGSPVHAVVRAREGDEGIFILVTQNWHRSSGDPVSDLEYKRRFCLQVRLYRNCT